MGFRFWINLSTVVAFLGLTIFSLVTFTDKNIEAENKPENYYLFAQVFNAGKKVIKFLEDPKSMFVKSEESEVASETAVPTESGSNSDSEPVIAYGDFAGTEASESESGVKTVVNPGSTSPVSSVAKGKGEAKINVSSEDVKEKFNFSKEVKALEEITGNLKDPNWRQQELPARISNTFKKYSESSANLMDSKGFFYNKTVAGHVIGWQAKSGKIYQVNLP